MTSWHEHRHSPDPGTWLCHRGEIPDNQVQEFRFGGDSPFAFRMFVYNDKGSFKAYRNSCPHFDVPLNYTTDQLISSDGKHFLCMTHYAKFDKGSGLCVEGPCEGESLEAIPIELDGDRLFIGTLAT